MATFPATTRSRNAMNQNLSADMVDFGVPNDIRVLIQDQLRRGVSALQVAERLNDDGHRTPYGNRWDLIRLMNATRPGRT